MFKILHILQSLVINIAMIYGAYWIIKYAFFAKKLNNKRPSSNKLINQKLVNIDISNISQILLHQNNTKGGYNTIDIHTANFYKIVKSLLDETGKTEFAPGELTSAYDFVVQNYESQLSPYSWEKIKDALRLFVQDGGRVEVIHGASTFSSNSDEDPAIRKNSPPNTLWILIKSVFLLVIALILLPVFICGGFLLMYIPGINYSLYIIIPIFGLLYFAILKGMFKFLF